MKKVLVLGGGFAGVEAAIFLRNKEFDVTLVSDRDYFYIYPTSIWVPTGEASFEEVSIPLRDLADAHGFELMVERVSSIQAKENKVVTEKRTLEDWDYLVVAIGSGKMKHKGNEHFLSICGAPKDSLRIKERLETLIERGSGKIAIGFGGNPKDSSSVRGGPAFEVLFNIHNRLKKLDIRQNFELTFFAPMEKPGARMGEKALEMMDIFFKHLDIKKQFGKKIKEFVADGVIFEDDSKLKSDFTMFIPAGNGHEVLADSDLPLNEAGFVKVSDFNQVLGFENVYAAGDCVALQGPAWRAKQGHIAEVMARNIAHNISVKVNRYGERKGYGEHINILCVMDTGDGAAFVYRNNGGGKMIPLPLVGHWLKKGWGWYCRNSKLGKIPRIPGM